MRDVQLDEHVVVMAFEEVAGVAGGQVVPGEKLGVGALAVSVEGGVHGGLGERALSERIVEALVPAVHAGTKAERGFDNARQSANAAIASVSFGRPRFAKIRPALSITHT